MGSLPIGNVTAGKAAKAGTVAAGLAVVAADTGRVLMLQRALTDGDPAGGFWEFPGGKLDPGETPRQAAWREWAEETGCAVPDGTVTGQWRSPNGVYEGFVLTIPGEDEVPIHDGRDEVTNPDDPDGDQVEALAWWHPSHLDDNPAVRPELADALNVIMPALHTAAAAKTAHTVLCKCLTCGCGRPNDGHGHPANITMADINAAAAQAGISPLQAWRNLLDTIGQARPGWLGKAGWEHEARVPAGGPEGGRWVSVGAIEHAIAAAVGGAGDPKHDRLKLAGRIHLDPGEHLLRSGVVEGSSGGHVYAAWTAHNGAPSLRLGTVGEISDEDHPKFRWTGNQVGLSDADRNAMADEYSRLIDDAEELEGEHGDQARLDELNRRIDEIAGQGFEAEPGGTAKLDQGQADQLRHELGRAHTDMMAYTDRLDAKYDQIDAAEAEINRLQLEVDKLDAQEQAWHDAHPEGHPGGMWWSPERVELVQPLADSKRAIRDRVAALEEETRLNHYQDTRREGVVPGQWADVHWAAWVDEVPELRLTVVPHGRDPDGYDETLSASVTGKNSVYPEDPDSWAALLRLLDMGTGRASKTVTAGLGKAPTITPGGRLGDDARHGSTENGRNWVEATAGELPRYIRIVRNRLMADGHDESSATALAVSAVKRWAAGGGRVSPKVQAAAAEAVAQWEAMRAAARASKAGFIDMVKESSRCWTA
jgi:8-oxo-dGTP pyrophosphatase MutT (NUDIX family)